VGTRSDAVSHIRTAVTNGFAYSSMDGAPVIIADGRGESVFSPVLFQPKDGDIICFYKCGDLNSGELITSNDDGLTWSSYQPLPNGILGPVRNKPVQLDNGTIIYGSSPQFPGPIHVEISFDNTRTWTQIGPIESGDHEAAHPTILVHTQTCLQMLMRTFLNDDDTKMSQTWSYDAGLTWEPITYCSLPNNNSSFDCVTLTDGRHLLVYNHSTRYEPGTGSKGRGILNVAVSTDGINWEAALVLDYRDDGSRYSYPAVIQGRDGLVHITYTWNRDRIKYVVINPDELVTYPIIDGEWPRDKIPWIESPDPPS
jgi:hypothetical protein